MKARGLAVQHEGRATARSTQSISTTGKPGRHSTARVNKWFPSSSTAGVSLPRNAALLLAAALLSLVVVVAQINVVKATSVTLGDAHNRRVEQQHHEHQPARKVLTQHPEEEADATEEEAAEVNEEEVEVEEPLPPTPTPRPKRLRTNPEAPADGYESDADVGPKGKPEGEEEGESEDGVKKPTKATPTPAPTPAPPARTQQPAQKPASTSPRASATSTSTSSSTSSATKKPPPRDDAASSSSGSGGGGGGSSGGEHKKPSPPKSSPSSSQPSSPEQPDDATPAPSSPINPVYHDQSSGELWIDAWGGTSVDAVTVFQSDRADVTRAVAVAQQYMTAVGLSLPGVKLVTWTYCLSSTSVLTAR
jgi:hypothetical protein